MKEMDFERPSCNSREPRAQGATPLTRSSCKPIRRRVRMSGQMKKKEADYAFGRQPPRLQSCAKLTILVLMEAGMAERPDMPESIVQRVAGHVPSFRSFWAKSHS
jgi:hypothetical protein